MALYFLILVCACLITACLLLKKNHREIAYLVGVFAVISLIAILILAPWQFLLLLLILVVISTSYEYYISKQNTTETQDTQSPTCEPEPEDNLIYRGVAYHIDPQFKSDEIKTSQVTHELHYRGGIYSVCVDSKDQPAALTTPSISYQLSFRGNTYSIKLPTEKLKIKSS